MQGELGSNNSLSTIRSIVLASASLPLAMMTLPLVVSVPEYFGNALGMNLALVGAVFTAVRVLDIVIDPALGLGMDRTTTRWGRFRPWMAAGVPLIVAGVLMLFMARPGVGAPYLFLGLLLAYLGWSTISLAQLALAAGLARGYADRARLYAWIQALFLIGTASVMLLPLVLGSKGNDPAAALASMGWLIIAVIVPIILLVWFAIPDRVEPAGRHRLGLADYLRLVARPAVARLLIADLLFGLGFGIASAVLVFFFIAGQGLDRSAVGLMLLAQMGMGVLSMPLMARAATRFGKHVVLAACGLGTLLTCPTMLLIPDGSVLWAAAVMAVWGIFYGGVAFLPRSMMADAGDAVRLESGIDRTGVLFALLISSWKLGGALSVGIGYIVLDLIGYQAKLGAANAPHALLGLKLLFAGAPAILGVAGGLVAWRYPLTVDKYRAIRAALDVRERAALSPVVSASVGPIPAIAVPGL